MERFDLFDDERKPLGKTIERGQKPGKGENRMVVHISIFNSKGEMLIQQRQSTKRNWASLWDISVGGCVVAGETSQMGAHRELLEELGIDYNFEGVRPHLTINFDNGFDDHYLIEKDIDLKDIVMQEAEVQDFKWASKEEIEKLFKENKFVPYVEPFIMALFELKNIHGAIND